jgi:hypothetical protein
LEARAGGVKDVSVMMKVIWAKYEQKFGAERYFAKSGRFSTSRGG